MAGFMVRPEAIVNEIARLLQERYLSGFPVLKELVQNADDALASEMHVGWVPGLSNGSHPLLRAPALFFVNDGHFRLDDKDSIQSIGINAKASEKFSIGKFGLGLKSVFHWCEAFFYCASDLTDPAGMSCGTHSEILNPWADQYGVDRFHEGWNDFPEADRLLIRATLAPIVDKLERWFILWVPLRRAPLPGESPGRSIVNEYPGTAYAPPAFVEQPELPDDLGALLPLLGNLTEIHYWHGQVGSMRRSWSVAMTANSLRRRYPSKELVRGGAPMEFHGQILASIGSRRNSKLDYWASEAVLDGEWLSRLRRSPYWPKSQMRDREADDKSEPHVACTLMKRPVVDSGAALEVQWAVFLPVGEAAERIACQGNVGYLLTLHGHFLVDSGRSRIREWQTEAELVAPQDEQTLCSAWNTELARRGTMRHILPVLSRAAQSAELKREEVESLTSALQRSQLFQHYREDITATSQWACVANETGCEWRLIDAGINVADLPRPPASDPARPWNVLPALRSLPSGCCLTYRSQESASPRLTKPGSEGSWTNGDLTTVLTFPPERVFTDPVSIDYLNDFLQYCAGQARNATSVQNQLREQARRCFSAIEPAALKPVREKARRFFSFISSEDRFAIPGMDSTVIKALSSATSRVLVFPKEFDSSDLPSCATLTCDEALVLLGAIDRLLQRANISDESITDAVSAVVTIMSSIPKDVLSEVLFRAGDLRILLGKEPHAGGRSVLLSPNELKARSECGTAFRHSPPPNQFGLASELMAAVPTARLVFVSREIAESILGVTSLAQCDAQGCISLIASAPPLADTLAREALVKQLSGSDIACLRYLLHGSRSHYGNEAQLMALRTGDSPAWGKLARAVLAVEGDDWRLVDARLADALSRGELHDRLRVEDLVPERVEMLLAERYFGGIVPTDFSPEERTVLLAQARSEAVWRAMPFHEDSGGDLGPIGEDVYLDTGFRVGPELQRSIRLITQSCDVEVRGRQEMWVPPWSAEQAIRFALGRTDPYRFFRDILDCLVSVEFKVAEDLLAMLRKGRWLADRENAPWAPEDVLHLVELGEEAERLLGLAPGTFLAPGQLHPDIRQHAGYVVLCDKLCSVGREALERLALLLSEGEDGTSDHCLGSFVHDAFPLKECQEVFGNEVPDGLPVWPLVHALMRTYPDLAEQHFVLPLTRRHLRREALERFLRWVSTKHQRAPAALRRRATSVFNAYLRSAVEHPDFREILPRLELLSRTGKWVAAGRLCSHVSNIDPRCVLDAEQETILGQHIFHASREDNQPVATPQIDPLENLPREIQMRRAQTEATLREYFIAWENWGVQHQFIGAFLALLGDRNETRGLAERYLEPFSLSNARDRLGWAEIRPQAAAPLKQLAGMTVHEAMGRHTALAVVYSERTVLVPSIVDGEPFSAEVGGEPDSILVGEPGRRLGPFVFEIRLRQLDVQASPPEVLSGVLKVSAERLLAHVYGQTNANLDDLWRQLGQGAVQLDIEFARSILLGNAPFYLQQLGAAKRVPVIAEAMREWDVARRMNVEEEHYKRSTGRGAELMRRALERLGNILSDDAEAQALVLEAVRSKLRDYQYRPQNIPFELFQNADDAAAELLEMRTSGTASACAKDGLAPRSRQFVVKQSLGQLGFAHWGRPINFYRHGEFPGKDRGFDRDLEKMLVLMSSDKVHPERVTGKFGLGFKSCLLTAAQPEVVSGSLAFKVVGGLLPERLAPERVNAIRELYRDYETGGQPPGTYIELLLESKDQESAETILREFRAWSGLLLAFARQLRQIALTLGGEERAVSWHPRLLRGVSDIEVARVSIGPEPVEVELVCFRCNSGSVAAAAGPRGFHSLPDRCPTLWVTAPLQETIDAGFAVNAQFEIDPGRASLAKSSDRNRNLAGKLGIEFGDLLEELWRSGISNWRSLADHFRFSPDTTTYEFWESVWTVFGNARALLETSDSANIMRSVRGGSGGLGRLAARGGPIPSGLPGVYQVTCKLDEIEYATQGCLDAQETFVKVARWPEFAARIPPGRVVCDERWAQVRGIVEARTVGVRRLRLGGVVRDLCGPDREVPPPLAGTLGIVVTPDFLDRVSDEDDQRDLESATSGLRFMSASGEYADSRSLLVLMCSDPERRDEMLRAAFAPSNRLLSSEYRLGAQSFFFACRRRFEAPAEQLVQWVLLAAEDHKRRAALRYLVEGDLGADTSRKLRPIPPGSWLHEVVTRIGSHPLLSDWNEADREELRRRIAPISTFTPQDDKDQPERARPDATAVLSEIANWWRMERHSRIAPYEARIYPDGTRPAFPKDFDPTDPTHRDAWLTLLLLAAQHRIGRTTPEQNRGFHERCRSNGWWDTFVSPGPRERATEWMEILNQHIDSQNDFGIYDWWMRDFVAVYRLATYLPEYVQCFLWTDRAAGEINLRYITNPRINVDQQGGGLDAPPIEKTLGLGVNFVLRELRRSGVLKNLAVDRHCYTPVLGLRRLMSVLGCPHVIDELASPGPDLSATIHRFLKEILGSEGARFEGDYDIPLKLVAEDQSLQSRFLGAPLDAWYGD